jgi:HTH-type transcriptional regulator/antitoxin HigA
MFAGATRQEFGVRRHVSAFLFFKPLVVPDKIVNNQFIASSLEPATWNDFFAALKDSGVPIAFLSEEERGQDREELGIGSFLPAIHNQAQYEHMVRLMNSLLDEIGDNEKHPLADLLEIVGDIIGAYEERNYPINDAEPREVLRLLMQQNSLQQKDLAGELGSQSVVSEILSGKREINARQAKALATRFAISPGAFL